MVEPGKPQTIWHMNIACCITKAANTHSQQVIIIAFPLQQHLKQCFPILRCTYIACLVKVLNLFASEFSKRKRDCCRFVWLINHPQMEAQLVQMSVVCRRFRVMQQKFTHHNQNKLYLMKLIFVFWDVSIAETFTHLFQEQPSLKYLFFHKYKFCF